MVCPQVRLLFQHARQPLDAYWLRVRPAAARTTAWAGRALHAFQACSLLAASGCLLALPALSNRHSQEITDAALDARGAGAPGGRHLLVKTHEWSGGWRLGRATSILVTHRDLRQARCATPC